ncbi:MAG: hypothetical protein EXR75_00615 [Myxococcales bacterium]|nr:hypothetical protein [Myxococcales bacterium]
MRCPPALVVALTLALTFAGAGDARAARKARVEWTGVTMAETTDSANRTATAALLSERLKQASKRAKWGAGTGPLKLSATVTRFDWQGTDDVVRLSVTVVARIADGPSARSHMRVGGKPDERDKLVREAFAVLADGLVTRLAELTRK